VRDGGAIQIAGVVFSFIYDAEIDSRLMILYTDFGEPPAEREATVYYELLKRNFVAGKGPVFTVSPITGHVVHVEHFRLDELTAALLAGRMASMAEEANDWRLTHFMSGRYALTTLDDSPPPQFPG
jgi:hypothetical protein